MSVALLGHIGLKQESALGEPASPPEVFGEILRESIAMDNNFIKPDVAHGSRFYAYALPGKVSAGGGLSLYLKPEGLLPWILKGLFGQVSSAEVAAGVYDHTFVPLQAARLPSFTIQVDHEAACNNWIGCSFSSVTLSIAPNGLLEMSVNLYSQRPAATQAAAPVYSETTPWCASNVEFTLNGESNLNFESFTLSFDNNIEPVWTMNRKRCPGRSIRRRRYRLERHLRTLRRHLCASASTTPSTALLLSL